ncbi:SGNH/GDSL hydrolase family protein [Streptomyces cyaneofuscatus]|uniref:SGNH/GDSL hydrolase family protein n=1 Tax=Streptomyces cyaneofuscatus TaxID=66883 RepID=UPI0038176B54
MEGTRESKTQESKPDIGRDAVRTGRSFARLVAGVAATAFVAALVQPAWGSPVDEAPRSAGRAQGETNASSVPPSERGRLLGEGWSRSTDVAWTTTSDARGFHLLTATEQSGYAWRTTASLSEPGFDADAWIGNACVTASGKRAVVVYAPRTFTNDVKLSARGGFTAIVDMASGKVTKLDVTASLSYYNPGCGVGESAVLTQSPGEDRQHTRLITVDSVTGKLSTPVVADGQITSAVPSDIGIVAANGAKVVRIDGKGRKTTLAATGGTPYRITPDADGGFVFLDRQPRKDTTAEANSLIKRALPDGTTQTLGSGKLSATGVARAAGTVYLTGETVTSQRLPSVVRKLPGADKDATVSTHARALVQRTTWADGKGSPSYLHPDQADEARSVNITATFRDTGRTGAFTVSPLEKRSARWDQGLAASPRLDAGRRGAPASSASRGVAAAGSSTELVESERVCSVPRNDPRNQAMQPKPRQVEWAVDQAIKGGLNKHISRAANWKNLGMPAYQPQTLFPNPTLAGGGRVPAQILLGITAQESNMWQAARSAVPGVTANPLIGNFYGTDFKDGSDADWDIDFSGADCGYGVTQVTDHMRMAGREAGHGGAAWDYQKQRAVALDYTANIAAGLQILVEKWNITKQAGLVVHDGDPKRLENWFFALWAYNSGFYENVNNNEPWGVGWANNPANPEWDAGRNAFMEDRYGNEDASAAARPQNWPYPEKVLGFAAHPPSFIESPNKMVEAFRPAWWNGTDGDATIVGSGKYHRARVKPPEDLFCGPYNSCDPAKISDGASNDSASSGPCTRSDFRCWFHQSVSWKTDCSYSCGNELVRFNDTYPEEADGTAYPPVCSTSGTGLPAGARIVDNVAGNTPVVRPGCSNSGWTNAGTFSLDFQGEAGTKGGTVWPGKVDTHQLGAGFGGHFYMSTTRTGTKGARLQATGTWKLGSSLDKWGRVMVHIPDHGAQTQQARYEIYAGATKVGERYIPTRHRQNTWVNLGVFDFRGSGLPSVKLSNVTEDGVGEDRVAWDAVAFVPLAAKPTQFVVALGDSYASGEGAGAYSVVSNNNQGDSTWNACRRSDRAWSRKVVLPGHTSSLGALADSNDPGTDFQFVACSGAHTWQLSGQPARWGSDGNFREIPQNRSGVLDDNTTLVTLTIGGNDANFPAIIQSCVVVVCPADDDMRRDIDSSVVEARQTLIDISYRAPNAKIVLLGYPQLFHATSAFCFGGVGTPDMVRMNTMADYMKDKQSAMVSALKQSGVRVVFESPDQDFNGLRVCDDPEGINALVTGQQGEGDFPCPGPAWCTSRESYHPNGVGTTAYAAALKRALNRP